MMTDEQIADWISNRRTAHRRGELPEWKERRINLIPRWEWQSWEVKPPEEWVSVAEKLAKENGGLTPKVSWLRRNGYGGLTSVLYRHPEQFAHIPRENNTPEKRRKEWVAVAEKLAKENGGRLQGHAWLTRNGYGGLCSCIRAYPSLFAHVPRENTHEKRRDQRLMPVAEKLAKESDGLIPGINWLKRNGYGGLATALRRYPEQFAHIPLEKLQNTSGEWVPIAEKLAEKHGGWLPGGKSLTRNGHGGLDPILRKYSELFAHIPQGICNSKGVVIGFRNGTAAQRRALEIKHGLRPAPRKAAAA